MRISVKRKGGWRRDEKEKERRKGRRRMRRGRVVGVGKSIEAAAWVLDGQPVRVCAACIHQEQFTTIDTRTCTNSPK